MKLRNWLVCSDPVLKSRRNTTSERWNNPAWFRFIDPKPHKIYHAWASKVEASASLVRNSGMSGQARNPMATAGPQDTTVDGKIKIPSYSSVWRNHSQPKIRHKYSPDLEKPLLTERSKLPSYSFPGRKPFETERTIQTLSNISETAIDGKIEVLSFSFPWSAVGERSSQDRRHSLRHLAKHHSTGTRPSVNNNNTVHVRLISIFHDSRTFVFPYFWASVHVHSGILFCGFCTLICVFAMWVGPSASICSIFLGV